MFRTETLWNRFSLSHFPPFFLSFFHSLFFFSLSVSLSLCQSLSLWLYDYNLTLKGEIPPHLISHQTPTFSYYLLFFCCHVVYLALYLFLILKRSVCGDQMAVLINPTETVLIHWEWTVTFKFPFPSKWNSFCVVPSISLPHHKFLEILTLEPDGFLNT